MGLQPLLGRATPGVREVRVLTGLAGQMGEEDSKSSKNSVRIKTGDLTKVTLKQSSVDNIEKPTMGSSKNLNL